MKVTFDLPDSTKAAFLNFVYENEKGFSRDYPCLDYGELWLAYRSKPKRSE